MILLIGNKSYVKISVRCDLIVASQHALFRHMWLIAATRAIEQMSLFNRLHVTNVMGIHHFD